MHAPTDADLLQRTRHDAGAFEVFYRRHVTAVLAFLTRRTNADVAADLTAEVFAIALEEAYRGRLPHDDPAHWLYGVARNLAATYFRTGDIERRAQRRLGIGDLGLEAEELERIEDLASLDVATEILDDALAALPAEQREAVVARVVREHSYADIGRDAHVTPVVARQRVSRGLAALRTRLRGSE